MVCIYCGSDTKVSNSRLQKKANQVWRRRACTSCGAVVTTTEGVDMMGAVLLKRNKRSEPFSRDTLLLSIYDSLKHRQSASTDATALTGTVLSALYPLITNATLDRDDVAQQTSLVLKRFDPVAATHYQAFHPLQATSAK